MGWKTPGNPVIRGSGQVGGCKQDASEMPSPPLGSRSRAIAVPHSQWPVFGSFRIQIYRSRLKMGWMNKSKCRAQLSTSCVAADACALKKGNSNSVCSGSGCVSPFLLSDFFKNLSLKIFFFLNLCIFSNSNFLPMHHASKLNLN